MRPPKLAAFFTSLSPPLAPCTFNPHFLLCITGPREDGGTGGPEPAEQHHGVDPDGLHRHHVLLPAGRRPDEWWGRRGALGDGRAEVVYGDRSEPVLAVRLFAILAGFLLAFLLQVQSIRHYSHATILINVGVRRLGDQQVWLVLVLALRAFYFCFPLFLWILGPVLVFSCCVAMVFLLYFLDVSSGRGAMGGGGEGREGDGNAVATTQDEC